MTDPFGIHAAQKMALDLFENASRRTGRTQALVAALRPGDAVVVPNSTMGAAYVSAIRNNERKAQIGYSSDPESIAVLVIGVNDDHRSRLGTNPHGQTHLSHEYVRLLFEQAIREASERGERIKRDLSRSVATDRGKIMTGIVESQFGFR